jgi:hypothetical protein
MALFVKKMNTGQLSFTVNGKRRVVKSGELVECSAEELGAKIVDFDEISQEKTKKNKASLLESEIQRFQSELFLKSWVLNPEWKPLLHQFVHTPKDLIGLKALLYDKEQEEIACREAYGEALRAWRYQVKRDPYKELKINNPRGHYIEPIARTTAALNHVLAEKKEVIRRIKNLDKDGLDASIQRRKKMFMKGILRRSLNRDGKFREVDGYEIEYRDDKPFIPELNKWLRTYIDEVKVYKITRDAAKSEKSIQARQEFLDSRKEKRLKTTQEKGVKL